MAGEAPQGGGPPQQGLLDTSILVVRRWINPAELPDEMAISAVTLAELSAGPHQVRPNGEQDLYDEHEERARRTEALQRAESEFDPVPFDTEAARVYGRVPAAVVAAGRKPRRRIADLTAWQKPPEERLHRRWLPWLASKESARTAPDPKGGTHVER